MSKSFAALAVLLGFVAISRVPLLDAGYGVNIDAWRVARVARHIAQTGQYEASRLPGYPVHEFACAALWRGGPVALNGASALLSLVAVGAFALLARAAGVRDWLLVSAAFAMTPVFYVNSVTSKDYVWAIAFVLCGMLAAFRGRGIVAGLCLGLAIGCRITSGAMVLPIALLLFAATEREKRGRVVVLFAATVLIVSTVTFAPVFGKYGRGFFAFYESHARPDAATVIARATVEVWGSLGVIALIVVLCGWIWCRVTGNAKQPLGSGGLRGALALMIVIYVAAYLRLPDQAGYLIPVVPAVLLFAALSVPRRALQTSCVLLISASFVDVNARGVSPGPIFADRKERLTAIRRVESLVAFCGTLPGKNLIVVGAAEPQIAVLFPDTASAPTRYVYLLSRDELVAAQKEGFAVYYLPAIRQFNASVYGFDLEQSGARNLRDVYAERARAP